MSTTRHYRTDRAPLRPPREDARGYLRVEGHAARTGILEYQDPTKPGGVRRELRRADALFTPAVLDGFVGAPVTDQHPAAPLDANSTNRRAMGVVLSARQDGDHVLVDMVLNDSQLISKARAGQHELSIGYSVEFDETPGEDPILGRYDGVQTGIEVNHLAVVDIARGGPTCRVRVDRTDAEQRDRAKLEAALARLAPHRRADSASMSDRDLALAVCSAGGVDVNEPSHANSTRLRDRSDGYVIAYGVAVAGWSPEHIALMRGDAGQRADADRYDAGRREDATDPETEARQRMVADNRYAAIPADRREELDRRRDREDRIRGRGGHFDARSAAAADRADADSEDRETRARMAMVRDNAARAKAPPPTAAPTVVAAPVAERADLGGEDPETRARMAMLADSAAAAAPPVTAVSHPSDDQAVAAQQALIAAAIASKKGA